MADYSDYLNYLHHIDDTTAQEFKKREDELRHQIDVVREQCRKDIRAIQDKATAEKEQSEAAHKVAIESLSAKYQSSIDKLSAEKKQLEEAHKAETARLKAEKEAAEKELSAAKASIEEGKQIAVNQALVQIKAEHESAISTLRYQYQSSTDKSNAEIKRLKESHERDLQKITVEKDAQILKLSKELAKFEAEKFSFKKVINKIREFVISLFMSAESDINDTIERKRIKAEEKARQEEDERRRQQEEERRRKENPSHGEESKSLDGERRFCRVCGNPLKPGALFCNKCGTKVK